MATVRAVPATPAQPPLTEAQRRVVEHRGGPLLVRGEAGSGKSTALAARVAALAADPDRGRWNGQSVSAGRLAQVYGFTDLDGSRPDIWRYIADGGRGRAVDRKDYR